MENDTSFQLTYKNPLVTVIVLTYKKFDNLENNISSILRQDYKNIEIIIQDDGSGYFPDNIIKLIESKKDIIRLYQNKENIGTVKNYNLAIARSNGEIIIPLSQDDIFIGSNAISNIVQRFQTSKCILCTGLRREKKTGKVYPDSQDLKLLLTQDKETMLLRMMIMNFISGAVLYFKKEAFHNGNHTIFDEQYYLLEDWPFVMECIDKGIEIQCINEVIIEFGKDGVSHQKKRPLPLLLDEKLLYEKCLLPKSRKYFSNTIELYIEYQYKKVLRSIREYGVEEKTNKDSLGIIHNMKQLFLVFRMSVYAKMKHNNAMYDRINFLIMLEEKKKCK